MRKIQTWTNLPDGVEPPRKEAERLRSPGETKTMRGQEDRETVKDFGGTKHRVAFIPPIKWRFFARLFQTEAFACRLSMRMEMGISDSRTASITSAVLSA